MSGTDDFRSVRVSRVTGETRFSIVLGPRRTMSPCVQLPNRILGHLLDHFCKGAGLCLSVSSLDWPGSWRFDHVLCEDMGQLVGRGVARIGAQRAERCGVAGRAACRAVMDEADVSVVMSMESRPRVDWSVSAGVDIDGFVDSWYGDDGSFGGWCSGTNLRQFIDGLALGSLMTLSVTVIRSGNLHHVYEAIFRGLGDAVRDALGLDAVVGRLPGESSGFAGRPAYEVDDAGDSACDGPA